MSAPAGVTATTLQSGGPGSYVITYSWTLGSSPSALSFSVTLYSIIWGVTAIVKGPINYTSSQLSDTYTNTVTGASYYCIVTAYAGAGQTGASAQFQSQQVSVYNPYGGPQGVQGYQGVQGLQGPTGPVGQQGLQGVQGLMQVTNYATTNQLITTGGDSTHLTAYPLFTLNGTTLSLGAGANITTAGTSNSIGGVTLNNGAVSGVTTLNASGAIATSAGFTGPSINTDSTSSSRVSGVTLNNGAVSGVTTLNASGAIATSAGFTGPSINTDSTSSSRVSGVTLNNGAVSGVTSLGMGGALSGVTTLNSSGAIATSAGFTGPSINTDSTSSSRVSGVTLNNGAVSGVTSLGMGGALSGVTTLNASGAIATSAGFTGPSINTDSTSSSRVSGVTLNNGAVSGVTSLGMGGALSGVTTLNASGAIATSAGFTGPSFSATNFVTAGGGFTGPSSSTINGISIGLTNQNVSGVGTLSCGAITAPSINNGANTFNVTATTGTNVTTMTVGAGNGTGYSISAGTISCGAITSSGALGLSTNGITSGTHNPSATDTYNLGITGTRWKQVVASNFTGALTGNADTATNVAYSGITGITSGSTFAGNAATATTAGGLTGTPAITVGTITGSSLALAGAISGVTTISNTASAAITSIGESARPVSNIYASTFTGALTGNATGLSGTPNISVSNVTAASATALLMTYGYVASNSNAVMLRNDGQNFFILFGLNDGSTFTSHRPFAIGSPGSTYPGRVGIGTNPNQYTLTVGGSVAAWSGYFFSYQSGTSTYSYWGLDTSTNTVIGVPAGGVAYLSNAASGSLTAWNFASDLKLKNIIAPLTSAISLFNHITPVYYTTKTDTTNTKHLGLIAQEVQQVFPEFVGSMTKDGETEPTLTLGYASLVTPLIAAVKELAARVAVLEAKLSNA